jgi:hypothetical protein
MFVTRDPADVVTKGRKVHGRDDDDGDDGDDDGGDDDGDDGDDDGGDDDDEGRGAAAFRFSLSEAHTEYI